MPPKKSPKKPTKAPTKAPPRTPARRSTGKTAEDVRALVRSNVTRDGAVVIAALASDEVDSHVIDWISTQSVALDALLGVPGIPCGRITEISGKNHSGKTTVAGHCMAEAQRRGGVAYLVDQDKTADKTYFRALGVDVDALEMISTKERSFESAVEAIEAVIDELLKHDILAVIVYDDIAAVETRHDLEQKFGKVQPGGMAKGIRGMCRRLLSKIAHSRIAVVVTNQTYSKVGVVFGNPEVAFGGDGFGIFATVRLGMRQSGKLPNDAPGTLTKVTCLKSKVSAASHRSTHLAIAWARGVDNVYSIHELLTERQMIGQQGRSSIVRLSEVDEVRWTGGWQGLVSKCSREPEVYARLVDAYRALTAPQVEETAAAPAKEEE